MSLPSGKDFPGPGEFLFAYGTLQRGLKYHYFLERNGARFVGSAQLPDAYPLLQLEYPCLLDEPGSGEPVSGEIYQILSPAAWRDIDWLEDHPIEYRRRLLDLHPPWHLRVWVYFYQMQSAEILPLNELASTT